MTTTNNASAYIPGNENINKEEITYRRRAGYVGVGLFLVVLALCLLFTSIMWWRLLLVLPAYLAAIGFLQAHYKFCVAYGSSARQNAEPGSKQAHTVTNEASLQKDIRRSRIIQIQAVIIAAGATTATFCIPPFK